MFFFAREVVSGRLPGQEVYRSVAFTPGKRINPGDFPSSSSLLTSFVNYVRRDPSWKVPAGVLQSEAAFIKVRLRYSIIMASYGAVAATQVLIEDDPQVAKAVESLPRAAQLAQSAANARQHQHCHFRRAPAGAWHWSIDSRKNPADAEVVRLV